MDNTSTLILGIALSIIMIGMGLSLTINDFKRVVKFPLAVFIGFLNQIILLPIIAYTLIKLFDVDSNTAIGIMILSACPGGDCSSEHSSDTAQCFPLRVSVFKTRSKVLDNWISPVASNYNQLHGL